MMKDTLRFLVLFVGWVGISLSGTTASANTSTLKCNSNKDVVWVYESLTNFDVEAKLNCGESVEIVERIKDFVRIRARNGVEGYIPDSEISDLPVFHDPTPDVGTVAKEVQAREIAEQAESRSPFIAPDASSRVSPSLNPTTGLAEKDVSKKTSTTNGPTGPIAPFAEINPGVFSTPVKKTSTNASAKILVAQPTIPSSKTFDGASAGAPEVTAPTTLSVVLPAPSAIAAADPDESPDLELNSESADPACRSYFSAYGMTSSQLGWIAQNRKKTFPTICPAPDPSKVNFVIIFTHDVDFFSATMPEPVHNFNGFSDFRAMTTVDTASKVDKTHREYVWVFQIAKGEFNPETFSRRRRYQFAKVESNSLGSNAGSKAVEDAFRFVEAANR